MATERILPTPDSPGAKSHEPGLAPGGSPYTEADDPAQMDEILLDDSPPWSSAPTLDLSPATAAALELPSLLSILARKAATDLGHDLALALRPTSDRAALMAQRQRFEEARRLVLGSALIPSAERPYRQILDGLGSSHRPLEGRDLVELGDLLEASHEASRRIAEAEPPCPRLAQEAAELADLRELCRLLRRTFDARGEIREDATPRLAEMRSRIRTSRQRIYEQMSSLVENHREHLSEETIPMRGGRLVLVLQSGSRDKVPGLVHGRSGSGRSFYFEPLEAVDSNNQLQQAVEDEEAEKRRILREVLEQLQSRLPEIGEHAAFFARLDLLQAMVRFAESVDARLAEIGERHELRLARARHPLLDPRLASDRLEVLGKEGHLDAVVPLDLELDRERRALVVTGPNAGGKTVALKTTGLLCLAHQCGLPVPAAAGTRLPILDSLVATVGDDQDLLADRSTFSGRLLRLKEAWELAGPDALMLLDELGSGTDPEEGSALSTALLEGLLERRCLVIVTTHLSQVAAAALEADGAFCAAMQFDSSTGEPTYRLAPGPPGGSEALALAHRLGLPSAWLERAEALLGSEHRDLRRLLAEVEDHRRELAESRARLDTEVRDAEKLRQRLSTRETELLEEKREVAKKLGRQLDEFRRQTMEGLRKEMQRLEAEMAKGRKKGLAAKATERLFEAAPVIELPQPSEELPVVEGGHVRHRRLGWAGVLEKLEKGRAQVLVQGKSILCKEKDLVGVDAAAAAPRSTSTGPATRGRVQRRTTHVSTPVADSNDLLDDTAPEAELMLVGQRVEPALERLDRFLDRGLVSSLSVVRIIHGHGTGRLRDAVRKHLSGHRAVAKHRPGRREEGGDGATVVALGAP